MSPALWGVVLALGVVAALVLAELIRWRLQVRRDRKGDDVLPLFW